MEKITIIEEKESPLFKRKEVLVSLKAEVTPSHEKAEKLISEKFSTNNDKMKIKKISGRFGSHEFMITANIYKSAEDKNRIEPKTKQEKEALKKAADDEAKRIEEEKKQKEETKKAEEQKQDIKSTEENKTEENK